MSIKQHIITINGKCEKKLTLKIEQITFLMT